MTLVAFDLARGTRAQAPATPYDAGWAQFITSMATTSAANAAVQAAATPASVGFTLDSSQGDTVLREARFADAGGALGSASASTAPLVTFDWTGGATLAVTQNGAWDAIKNFQLTSFDGTALTLAKWVDVDVQLADNTARSITIEGAKRGNIKLGDGADTLTVGVESNVSGSGNGFRISTGGGDDTVAVRATATNYTGGAYTGAWTTTSIDTGSGNDIVFGWGSNDTLDGGAGTDTFVLRGVASGYSIATSNGVTTIRDTNLADGNDGTDTLRNVETVRFADGTTLSLLPNHAPVVAPSSATLTEDDVGVLLPALSRATDPDGNALSLVSASAQFGTVTIEGGALRYTPPASAQALNNGQSLADTITYGVSDGQATTAGTVAVTVTGITDAPAGPVPTITVGAGKQYATLSAAVAASHDGDIIGVDAGTYVNDFATINTKITILGIGGMAHFVASGPINNGKGIFITNTDVTIDHLEFSGATVADMNGAGIRYQAGNLVIRNSYFHDNQDGILANASATGTISIDHSEFARNGAGDGYSHNLYVGNILKLSITDSYFHDARVGHEIKSRAQETIITGSRIFDGPGGTASYSIDLPNGGRAVVQGNVIEQSSTSQNPAIIHFGGESAPYAGSSLLVSGNVVANHLVSGSATLVLNQSGTVSASVSGNSVYGLDAAHIASGPASVSGTTFLTTDPVLDTSAPWTLIG